MAELQKALKVVQTTMKHRGAKLLFNQKVDPVSLGLHDYFKIVKHPMDLGTVCDRLSAAEYSSPSQVKSDVDLIWSNCYLYNSRPEDQPTRDLCAEVQQQFERLWAEANFAPEEPPARKTPSQKVTVTEIDEAAVPEQYNILQGSGELPLRLLSDFAVCLASNLEKLVPLKSKLKSPVVLRGTLLAPEEAKQRSKRKQVHLVQTQPMLDWCFQYGETAGVWAITDQAWYKLVAPAAEFSGVHRPVALKLAVCNAAVRELLQDPDLEVSEAIDRALSAHAVTDRTENRLGRFVEAQLSAWIKDRLQAEEDDLGSDRADDLSGPGPHGSKRQAEDGGVDAGRQKRRKIGSQGLQAGDASKDAPADTTDRAEGELPGDEPMDQGLGMTARQRSRDIAARKARLEAEAPQSPAPVPKRGPSRAQRDRNADAVRGPPPQLSRSTRSPAALVPDLIMVYELLQAMGGLLQITPFPLWRLEAAICPGPHPPPEQPATAAPSPVPKPLSQGGPSASEQQQPAAAQSQPEAVPDGSAEVQRVSTAGSEPPTADLGLNMEPGDGRANGQQAAAAVGGDDMDVRQNAEETAEQGAEPAASGLGLTAEDVTAPEMNGAADEVEALPPGQSNPEAEQKLLRRKKKKRKFGKPPKPPRPPENLPTLQKRGMKLHLKLGGTDISRRSDSGQSAPKPSVAMDREVIASAVVLREVHCALLRAVEGSALTPGGTSPHAAQLVVPPEAHASQAQWCERVANAVLSAAEPVDPEAWEAALQLAYGEYWQLSPQQRLTLLRCLVHLTLGVEAVRDHLQALVEAPVGLRANPLQLEDGQDFSSLAAAPAIPPPGSVDEWEAWKESVRVSIRKPLGVDYAKRRYWAVGGRASAWRVFVEEEEGSLWGWYEGRQICELVEWLRAGGIMREASLLSALAKAPLPGKFVPQPLQRPSAGTPLELPNAAATLTAGDEDAAAAVVSAAELSGRRPDGMRGFMAPLLRGEGAWPDMHPNSRFPVRIFYCLDALLADIPFWFEEGDWISRRTSLLQAVRDAESAATMGPALLAVEEALSSRSCMDEEWPQLWREHWRAEVVACSQLQDSLLYTVSLQEHVRRQKDVMPRPAFDKFARDNNCQLHIPRPGEEVVVLRTGVLQHLSKYMQSLGLEAPVRHAVEVPTAEEPSAPAEGGTAETLDAVPLEGTEMPLPAEACDSLVGMHEDSSSIPPPADPPEIPRSSPKQAKPEGRLPGPEEPGTSEVPPTEQQEPAETSARPEAEQNLPKADAKSSASPQPEQQQNSGGREPEQVHEGDKPEATPASADHGAAVAAPSADGNDAAAAALPAEQLPEDLLQQLRSQWRQLKAKVQGLRHVERFRVATIAYRRNLFDGTAAEHLSRETDAEGEAGSDAARWPVAWLLLQPLGGGAPHHPSAEAIVLPLRIDLTLPDFLTAAHAFDACMRRRWSPGQRFRMFFGGKRHARARTAGVYYKGTIAAVRPRPAQDAPAEQQAAFDPWEAIQVEWDASRGHAAGECENVSPWEIERDPDDLHPAPEELRAPEEALPSAPRTELPAFSRPGDFGSSARKRRRVEDDTDWEPVESPTSSLGGGEWRPSRAERVAARQRALENSAGQSTAVPQEVLDALQPLSRERFVMLLGNWYRINRGKFKVPIFAHQELDLHRVFWEVQARGGSDLVTAEKMWKEVCRSLGVDLTGQTSASYNMRLNYERCLLEFEHYLASGQYLAELAADQAPSPDFLQQAPKAQPPGREPSVGGDSVGVMTRRSRDPRNVPQETPDFSGSGTGLGLDSGFSFTKLLGLEDEGLAAGTPIPPPLLSGTAGAPDHLAPAWRRLVAPPGVFTPPLPPGQGWEAAVLGVPPVARANQHPLPSMAHASPGYPFSAQPGAELDPMQSIVAALHAGYTAEALHSMVDRAVAHLTPAAAAHLESLPEAEQPPLDPPEQPPGPEPSSTGMRAALEAADPGSASAGPEAVDAADADAAEAVGVSSAQPPEASPAPEAGAEAAGTSAGWQPGAGPEPAHQDREMPQAPDIPASAADAASREDEQPVANGVAAEYGDGSLATGNVHQSPAMRPGETQPGTSSAMQADAASNIPLQQVADITAVQPVAMDVSHADEARSSPLAVLEGDPGAGAAQRAAGEPVGSMTQLSEVDEDLRRADSTAVEQGSMQPSGDSEGVSREGTPGKAPKFRIKFSGLSRPEEKQQ